MKEVHLYISGFVQGVGFRNFVQYTARKMGVVGWTRNLVDRRVEVIAQADEKTLKKFVEICSRGPFLSEVKSVSIEWGEPNEIFEEFKRRPTA
ncbi:MAG TPA: acylphosphatase [Patescibacteria group bacterium]|nr:acylphosphatase [Patescibacteria group bacterium]